MVDHQHLSARVGELTQRAEPVDAGNVDGDDQIGVATHAFGPTSRWPPGSDCSDSGSSAGAAKLTSTALPAWSSTNASASPAPMVSASG